MEENKKDSMLVRSFRVSSDVLTRFKTLQDELHITQDGALKMLVDAYEFEQAKKVLSDRETEISNFQLKVNELCDAFLHSLQLNEDAENRVRSEVALQLDAKDRAIADYQTALEVEKEKAEACLALQEELKFSQQSVANLETLLHEKDKSLSEAEERFKKQLEDKDRLVRMLQEKLDNFSQKAEDYDALSEKASKLAEELKARQEEEREQKRLTEKELDAAVASVKAEKELMIADLKENLQNARIDAERQLRACEKEYMDEIRSLEKEIGNLKVEIAGARS